MGRSRYGYAFEGENRYTFTMENSQDGRTWTMLLEGRYTLK